jgi:23S rRNA G2445 N2-methylase RlmL
MTSAQKAKGSTFEREGQAHARDRGLNIERLRATGVHDEGDLALYSAEFYTPRIVIPAVLHKRRMKGIGQAYLTVEYDSYLTLNKTIDVDVVTILEAKNRKSMDLAEWVDEAVVEADNWKKHRGFG